MVDWFFWIINIVLAIVSWFALWYVGGELASTKKSMKENGVILGTLLGFAMFFTYMAIDLTFENYLLLKG